jgi:hypothetical protein
MRTVERKAADLSSFPDLVVIYLGMRVNRLTGIKTLLGFGLRSQAQAEFHVFRTDVCPVASACLTHHHL